MSARAKRVFVVMAGGLLLLAASPRTSLGQIVGEERAAADTAFLERRYDDSAKAYAQVVQTQRNDGEAWFRLGFSLHASKQYSEAVPAYRRAIELKYAPLMSYYNIACVYAMAGNRERALTALEEAVAKGYNTTDQIEQDADLASVRDDPRYSAAVRRTRDPISALGAGGRIAALFGLWTLEGEDGSAGTMTGNVSAKGFGFHLECYDGSGRVFYVLFVFSAKAGVWLASGADRFGGIYEGPASLSGSELVFSGRRAGPAGGRRARVTVDFGDPGEAVVSMESMNQGAWTTDRSYLAESSRPDRRMNGGR
ncbi:MAG: tetratricopeptide repeat protein [Fimbriimonadaceae bacterium]